MQKKKLLFIVFNTIVIIFYVYPASILGYILFDQPHKQPQITPDFMQISSNHFYTFVLLSIIGLIAFFELTRHRTIYRSLSRGYFVHICQMWGSDPRGSTTLMEMYVTENLFFC